MPWWRRLLAQEAVREQRRGSGSAMIHEAEWSISAPSWTLLWVVDVITHSVTSLASLSFRHWCDFIAIKQRTVWKEISTPTDWVMLCSWWFIPISIYWRLLERIAQSAGNSRERFMFWCQKRLSWWLRAANRAVQQKMQMSSYWDWFCARAKWPEDANIDLSLNSRRETVVAKQSSRSCDRWGVDSESAPIDREFNVHFLLMVLQDNKKSPETGSSTIGSGKFRKGVNWDAWSARSRPSAGGLSGVQPNGREH